MPKEHTIRQGETLVGIAQKNGMLMEKIWDDPANSELKDAYENPNVLQPGEVITIPDKDLGGETIATESCHTFRTKLGMTTLKIKIMENDEPRANVDYILNIDGKNIQGTTDGDGLIEQKIPAGSKQGKILIGDHEEIPIRIGRLDPVNTIRGVQMRLNNLGYNAGTIDGKLGPQTKAAIRGFQGQNEIETTGEPNDETQDKLVEKHGS